MTHPSLDRRPASVQMAKEVLEKPQQINQYSLPVKQGNTLNTFSLLGNAIWRSAAIGTLAIGNWVAIYSTFLFPHMINFGGFQGFLLGLILGLGNGIILGIVTRLWFFPLTNPKLHREVLSAISIVFCTCTSIIFYIKAGPDERFILSYYNYNYYFSMYILLPSLIAGLLMGAITDSITRWYQKASRL
jgi:hypothetical protein